MKQLPSKVRRSGRLGRYNRSHFFNRFICLPVALVLIFTATVQAAEKPPVTSA